MNRTVRADHRINHILAKKTRFTWGIFSAELWSGDIVGVDSGGDIVVLQVAKSGRYNIGEELQFIKKIDNTDCASKY